MYSSYCLPCIISHCDRCLHIFSIFTNVRLDLWNPFLESFFPSGYLDCHSVCWIQTFHDSEKLAPDPVFAPAIPAKQLFAPIPAASSQPPARSSLQSGKPRSESFGEFLHLRVNSPPTSHASGSNPLSVLRDPYREYSTRKVRPLLLAC